MWLRLKHNSRWQQRRHPCRDKRGFLGTVYVFISIFVTTEAIEHFEKTFPNVNQLVCTLGADGVLILDKGKKYNFKATEAKVIDKTGAGDFFAAGYLFGLQKGFSIVESAEIANKSAAHVISEVGVRPKKEFT